MIHTFTVYFVKVKVDLIRQSELRKGKRKIERYVEKIIQKDRMYRKRDIEAYREREIQKYKKKKRDIEN